ncbi:MAG: hypothetical protein RJQ04_05830 [Longimicrobiales bacterium]
MTAIAPLRRPGHLGLVAAVLGLAACGGSPADPDGTLSPTGPDLPAEGVYTYAWLGTFEGVGDGVVGDTMVHIRPARLRIALDADSVALDRCPLCVTLELDTLFALTNASLDDPVRLSIEYVRDGRRRTLLLERFSSGSTTGNVLSARLLVEPEGGGAATADISYLLERR